ncbi:hypothetical protein D3C80_1735060 [compost metagenome]
MEPVNACFLSGKQRRLLEVNRVLTEPFTLVVVAVIDPLMGEDQVGSQGSRLFYHILRGGKCGDNSPHLRLRRSCFQPVYRLLRHGDSGRQPVNNGSEGNRHGYILLVDGT